MVGKTTMDKAVLDSYLRQFAAGNQDAFRKMYDYVKDSVFYFALSIVKNYQTAEDVLQECMLRVARKTEKYEPGTNPKAWLFSITRNLCNNALNSPYNRTLPLEEAQSLADTQADMVKSTEEADMVLAALQILTAKEREVVSLHVYAGFKQTEIAEILQIPYVRVRSRYKSAVVKLREYFIKVNYEIRK